MGWDGESEGTSAQSLIWFLLRQKHLSHISYQHVFRIGFEKGLADALCTFNVLNLRVGFIHCTRKKLARDFQASTLQA